MGPCLSIILLLIQVDNLVSASANSGPILKHTILPKLNNTNQNENHTDYEKICKEHICVPKCCAMDTYVHTRKSCARNDSFDLDFSDLSVYYDNISTVKNTLKDTFMLVPDKFKNGTFREKAFDVARAGFNLYLSETGILHVELPNSYHRWILRNSSLFCVDYQIIGEEPMPRFWVILDDEESQESNVFFKSAILVSCVFLLLVLVVYSLLPELRNLCGMILMAYVVSLFGAFLLLAVIQIWEHDTEVCLGLTFSIYFFFLSSFCWMSVMSFDIWWTFRGYAKARPIHRRGERFKFLMYCLYAWGLPLAMTIALAFVNSIDLRRWPWIITPNIPLRGCFIEGGEKLLYLYMPMLILIVCNWMFYLMTAFNVWRLSRGTAVLDSAAAGSPAAHRTHLNRFMVYLKLSIVMGLNWVLELVSFVFPDFAWWYITDTYNILIGLAIFLIFVCKKKIFKKLIKRYGRNKNSRWSPTNKSYSSSSTSDCNSRETSLPPVCTNPKGPAYQMKAF